MRHASNMCRHEHVHMSAPIANNRLLGTNRMCNTQRLTEQPQPMKGAEKVWSSTASSGRKDESNGSTDGSSELPICPAVKILNANINVLMNTDVPETVLAALGGSVASANSLNELGTSPPFDSCSCIATCAIVNPDIKHIIHAPIITPKERIGPGPATTAGNANIPAPTVLPVIINDADATGSINDSRSDGSGILAVVFCIIS